MRSTFMTNSVLVGTFTLDGCYTRQIWDNISTGIYIVTDENGVAPQEIGEEVFSTLLAIEEFYKLRMKYIHIVPVAPTQNPKIATLHAGCE